MPKLGIDEIGSLKSQHAQAVRWHGADSIQAQDTKEKLAAAKAVVDIKRTLSTNPPLSDTQRIELAKWVLQPVSAEVAELVLHPVRVDSNDGGDVDDA